MIDRPFHEVLRDHFRTAGYNQTQLAARTGIDRRRISKLLAGKARPGPVEFATLCRIFPHGARDLHRTLRDQPLRRAGRVPMKANREVHRLIRSPRLCLPPQRKATRKFWPGLRVDHGQVFNVLRERVRRRGDLGDCLRHLRRTACDSKFELAAYVHALADGAGLCVVSVLRLGFTRLLAVDPDTRELVGHRPMVAYLLRRGADRAILIPQVSLLTRGGPVYTLDALTALIRGRRVLWADFEVDGDGHNPAWDAERAEALQLPELRFTEPDAVSPGFMDRFWARANACLMR